jgi:hypothetical protein
MFTVITGKTCAGPGSEKLFLSVLPGLVVVHFQEILLFENEIMI